jgi:hypothetical protein
MPRLTADSLQMDSLELLFFERDERASERHRLLHAAARAVLMNLSANPVRKVLVGGRRVRSDDGPRIYGISQIIGACETVMAATRLVLEGYPQEVPTLARRALETAALALYYIDKPGVWHQMVRDGPRRKASEAAGRLQTPKIGSVLQHLWERCRSLGDPAGFKQLYDRLSDHAHSAPGIRASTNFEAIDLVRLGPLHPSEGEERFVDTYELLNLMTKMLGLIAGFAYGDELQAADEAGEWGPLEPGAFAGLVAEGKRLGLADHERGSGS